MPPLQEYIEHADEHFQSVLAERDRWLLSGTLHEMPAELRALVDKGFLYHNAKKIADDRRKNERPLSEEEANEETVTRKNFAIAYREHNEITKHAWMEKAAGK